MWNNLFTKLQDQLEGAVKLLKEDEDVLEEEYDEEGYEEKDAAESGEASPAQTLASAPSRPSFAPAAEWEEGGAAAAGPSPAVTSLSAVPISSTQHAAQTLEPAPSPPSPPPSPSNAEAGPSPRNTGATDRGVDEQRQRREGSVTGATEKEWGDSNAEFDGDGVAELPPPPPPPPPPAATENDNAAAAGVSAASTGAGGRLTPPAHTLEGEPKEEAVRPALGVTPMPPPDGTVGAEAVVPTAAASTPSALKDQEEATAAAAAAGPPPTHPIAAGGRGAADCAWVDSEKNAPPPLPGPPAKTDAAQHIDAPAGATVAAQEGTVITPLADTATAAAARARDGGSADGDTHAQLLRFQQQLADEMASGVALAEENALLKARLAEQEKELVAARKTIAASADAGETVSTLIEKLGREKARSKHVAEERNSLREQVAELGGLVEEYRAKEATWLSSHAAQSQSQSSAQSHIAQLEADLHKRTAQVEQLEERLADTERTRSLLSTQLQEARRTHDAAVAQVRERGAESLEQAEREVERLRAALRSGSAEYDERVMSLEQELREAVNRAYQAEERLSDLERGAVGSLGDLRNELEDMQARVSSLTSEVSGLRSENGELLERLSSMKRARATAEAAHKEKLAALTSSLAALTEEKSSLAKALSAAKAHTQAVEGELTELRRRCMILEAARPQGRGGSVAGSPFPPSTTATKDAAAASGPVSGPESPTVANLSSSCPASVVVPDAEPRGSEPATPASTSTTRSRGGGAGGGARPPALFAPTLPFGLNRAGSEDGCSPSTTTASVSAAAHYHSPFGFGNGGDFFSSGGGIGASSRTRVEREVVRQAVEIERLKKTEAEAVSLRARVKDLESQYDLMLQLYGQVEEELRKAKAQAAQDSPASPK